MTTDTATRPAKKATPRKRIPAIPVDTKAVKAAPRKRSPKVQPPSVVEPVAPAVDVDSLNRTQLYKVAKVEAEAVKAWETGGETGPRPATPALDRLKDPASKAKREKAERASKYDDTKGTLIERVTNARGSGVSFPRLAVELNAERFDGKTDWTGPKLYAFACRHNVGKLPLIKAAKS